VRCSCWEGECNGCILDLKILGGLPKKVKSKKERNVTFLFPFTSISPISHFSKSIQEVKPKDRRPRFLFFFLLVLFEIFFFFFFLAPFLLLLFFISFLLL